MEFKEKYLKYKTKYFELKKLLKGGDFFEIMCPDKGVNQNLFTPLTTMFIFSDATKHHIQNKLYNANITDEELRLVFDIKDNIQEYEMYNKIHSDILLQYHQVL